MAKKEFSFKGKSLEELKTLSINEFAQMLPSRERRSLIKRGLTENQKKLMKKLEAGKNNVKTQCRQMIILPIMVGKTIRIHRGNSFVSLIIQDEMVGHRLGEFVQTRKGVSHSSPGVGATRSSASVSVR